MAARVESHIPWRKSSFSASDANCVEVAFGVGVRDSKNPAAGHLALPAGACESLLSFARHQDLP